MSSQSIVCATCNAAVPYGRLSCPACGELLASVAGAARPAVARASKRAAKRSTPAAIPAVLVDVVPPSAAVAAPERVATKSLDWDPPGWETSAPPDDTNDRDRLEWPVAGGGVAPYQTAVSDREPAIFQAVPAQAEVVADAASPAFATPAGTSPGFAAPHAAPRQVAAPTVPAAPGAYVPPLIYAEPAGPPAPARAWAGQPSAEAAPSDGVDPRTAAKELLDAARVPEFVGWLAVAGAALAAVGFVLPWGISVIGAQGVGYFDRWGLAGPFHPIVFLSLLGVLGLSLVPNPIPLWLRVGVPGLGLGALLIGLVWPYLVGLSGTGPGALVIAIGATILGVAGVAALVTDRHAAEDRPV